MEVVVRKILEVVKPDLIKQKANAATSLIKLNSQYMLILANIKTAKWTEKELKNMLTLSQQLTNAFSDALQGVASAKDLDEIEISLKTIEEKLQGFPIYCVKCKSEVRIQRFEQVTMKNGKPAVKTVCPNCGTKMFKIGAK